MLQVGSCKSRRRFTPVAARPHEGPSSSIRRQCPNSSPSIRQLAELPSLAVPNGRTASNKGRPSASTPGPHECFRPNNTCRQRIRTRPKKPPKEEIFLRRFTSPSQTRFSRHTPSIPHRTPSRSPRLGPQTSPALTLTSPRTGPVRVPFPERVVSVPIQQGRVGWVCGIGGSGRWDRLRCV